MSNRLNKEREKEYNPKRLAFAKDEFIKHNIPIIASDNVSITIQHNGGQVVKIYPYSGWFTGKGVKDGRGIKNLLKQIKSCI